MSLFRIYSCLEVISSLVVLICRAEHRRTYCLVVYASVCRFVCRKLQICDLCLTYMRTKYSFHTEICCVRAGVSASVCDLLGKQ